MPWIAALLPSVVVGLVFWAVMRAVMRADRSERDAEAKYNQEHKPTQENRQVGPGSNSGS